MFPQLKFVNIGSAWHLFVPLVVLKVLQLSFYVVSTLRFPIWKKCFCWLDAARPIANVCVLTRSLVFTWHIYKANAGTSLLVNTQKNLNLVLVPALVLMLQQLCLHHWWKLSFEVFLQTCYLSHSSCSDDYIKEEILNAPFMMNKMALIILLSNLNLPKLLKYPGGCQVISKHSEKTLMYLHYHVKASHL